MAFPSISTGAYGYPLAAAARIALQAVLAYLAEHAEVKLVRFVLFGHPAYEVYAKILRELLESLRFRGALSPSRLPGGQKKQKRPHPGTDGA